MPQMLARLIFTPIAALMLCIAIIRVGYGIAYPVEPAGIFAMSECELPCPLGLEPFVTTETQIDNLIEELNPWFTKYDPINVGLEHSGIAIGVREFDLLVEYNTETNPKYVNLLTIVFSGDCSSEIFVELGQPDIAYFIPEEDFHLFTYTDYRLTVIFTSRMRSADLPYEILGYWHRAIDHSPLHINHWTSDKAVDMFNYCR